MTIEITAVGFKRTEDKLKHEVRETMLEVPERVIKAFDEYGTETSEREAKYVVAEAILPQDSVKVVKVYERVDGSLKERVNLSTLDSLSSRLAALEGLPVQVATYVLSRLSRA